MSDVLLDTHVALWLLTDDPRLGDQARTMIRDADGVHVSAASLWEIEIKRDLGKLTAPPELGQALATAGVAEVPITWHDSQRLRDVELPHRDPFDRMLLAQATQRGWGFLTADRIIVATGLPYVVDART